MTQRVDAEALPDGTGAERILRVAVDLFGRHGVRATSLKAIAADAGVSPALILHHYGSKDGLRVACDTHVAATLRGIKADAVARGTRLDPLSMFEGLPERRPLVRYFARTVTDGSPHVNELVDQLVADAERYTADAQRQGLVRSSSDPKARIVVLLLASLGTLVLHPHLERLLGVDLIDGDEPPMRYYRALLEIYFDGVFADDSYPELRAALDVSAPVAGEEGQTDDNNP
ncbi:TetR/AcrR family transcriptional regulator [Georgenia sunbinii]|uniref:TetR/AcrR family transcriptional regulator n=1 Tax=Georgenia sunbinii TaxID=3117728 RepID=UPI002F267E53